MKLKKEWYILGRTFKNGPRASVMYLSKSKGWTYNIEKAHCFNTVTEVSKVRDEDDFILKLEATYKVHTMKQKRDTWDGV